MSRYWIGMVLLGLALATAPTRTAEAQPYTNGWLATCHEYVYKWCRGSLHIGTNHGSTLIMAGWGCKAKSPITMDKTNRKALILLAYYNGGILEADLHSLTMRTISLPQTYQEALDCLPSQNGGLTLLAVGKNNNTDLIQLDANYTSYTTLRANITGNMSLACRDLTRVGYIVLDRQRAVVQRLSPDGTTLTTIFSSANLEDVAQSHIDGSTYVATGWRIYRLAGPSITSFSPPRQYYASICFDRWTGQGALITTELRSGSASIVHRMTPSGVPVSSFIPNITGIFTDMTFARGRNVATEHLAHWNHWGLRLSFPGEAGRPYALALSATGFTPGMPVAGG